MVIIQPNQAPSLLALPAELRLHIYTYLLPLEIPCGDLRGLVLSCRLIKEEVYHEMLAHVQALRTTIAQRWPFAESFHVVFPGRLFRAKDVILDVPYLPERLVFYTDATREAWNSLFRAKGLALPVPRMTIRIGDIPGNPRLNEQLKIREPARYMRLLARRYCFVTGTTRICGEAAKEREIRFKDGAMAFRRNVNMTLVDEKWRRDVVHPQDYIA